MTCNFTYNYGLIKGSVTTADIIQATTPNWVYVISLAYAAPGQKRIKPSFLKIVFVCLGIIGIGILCQNDLSIDPELGKGSYFNIMSAIGYGAYSIALNAVVGDADDFDYGLFLGFVGAINVILLIPVMIILHIWSIQVFIVPTMYELAANFGYSLLSCIANEYFWAKSATLLGPI